MRRLTGVLVLVLSAAGGRAAAQTVVFGVGGQVVGEAGAVVRVPVYADMTGAPGQKLGSYTVRLAWTPGILTYQGMDPGLFGQPVVVTDSTFAGVLRVGGLSASGVEGLFGLFSARMVVAGSQTSPLTLAVSQAVAAGTFTDLTSQVTVVNGTYCPAVGRWGDLDGDGQANSRDALGILSWVVDLPLDPGFTIALGDVDGDGVVNSRDALITLSHAVGLAIPGQRVLVYAPGACGGAGQLGITILPDTVDVAVGQYVHLLVTGSVGGVPAGASVSWSVANPELAVVSAEGVLAGRAAGTTAVSAALGPGITASVPVIVRARRGTWYVDAGRAPFSAVQLGTQKHPFATPQYAFPVAQDGDTVRVAPGVHDYLGGEICTGGYYGGDAPPAGGPPAPVPPPEQCALYGDLARSIVLWGDTLADGTRPVLRGNPESYRAVQLRAGVSFEMHHLVLRGFQEAIYQYNSPSRSISVENVQFDLRGPNSSSGILASYGVDTLRLRRVQFIGDPAQYGVAVNVSDGLHVAVLDDVSVDQVQYGIQLNGVDSLDVRDSRLHPSASHALEVYGPATATRAYISGSDLQSPTGYALYATNTHVTSSGNRYSAPAYGAYIYNPTGSGWQVAMDRDTVFADSAQGGYTVYLHGNVAASIRRSRIVGGGYGLYANLTAGTLALDSNVITGTRTYGVYASVPAGASLTGRWNNVTDNRLYGVYSTGAGTVAFTNGRFVLNRSRAVYAGSGSVDATNNWWGAASGPGGGVGDSVLGTVTTSPFLTSDPAGVSVPPLGPPAGAFTGGLWRTSVGGRRTGPVAPARSEQRGLPADPAWDAQGAARQAAAEQRSRELLATQRKAARVPEGRQR
jgi:hypothetical protein